MGDEDRTVRAHAENVYFRKHVLLAADMRNCLAHARFATKSPNYELVEQRFTATQYGLQVSIMANYLDSVRKTVEAMGGGGICQFNQRRKDADCDEG